MKRFARLYSALDAQTSTNAKVAALVEYFKVAASRDAAWAVFFLTGNRPRQAVKSTLFRAWGAEAADIPQWLFEESYDAVGDIAETIALLLPAPVRQDDATLSVWIEERLLPLRDLPEAEQKARLFEYWSALDGAERFVFNKLITGGFRVGVSQLLVTRALAEVSGVDAKIIAHRLTGNWQPTADNYARLIDPSASDSQASKPYPFFLAHALEAEPESLGDIGEWIAEWKWDGIRAQLVKRGGEVHLWSRGDELISGQFPELIEGAAKLPECVIDGEVLPWRDNHVLPFATLQKRLGRKNPGKKIRDEAPVILLAYDLLEQAGEDLRDKPMRERRSLLADTLYSIAWQRHETMRFDLSPRVRMPDWATLKAARSDSRTLGTEGLMLKRADSAYGVGRTRGDWWKWKVDPYTLDCVLVYAQRGHGKRASLYTDYTFALWRDTESGRELVPFAKAYSGLSDEEIREVDAFIRKNTLEKFGPVRTVKPQLVFELAFEGIQRSTRHKSGIAVRFPRMARMRFDKKIEDADTVDTALVLINST